MSYLPELHRCAWCHVDLGAENGDGTCGDCDAKLVECGECGEMQMPDKPCPVCEAYHDAPVVVGGMCLDVGTRRDMTRTEYRRTLRFAKLAKFIGR